MNFFTRLSNGWNIALNSFKVLKENRQLILFPLLSGLSMILVIGSFSTAVFALSGWDTDTVREQSRGTSYLITFAYYLVNYFVIVFFNTALVHCTHLYFKGEEPTVREGLRFAVSRIGTILSWAVFAATVGTILRILQDSFGSIGKFVTGGLLAVMNAVKVIFVSAIYHNINGDPVKHFNQQLADNLFIEK